MNPLSAVFGAVVKARAALYDRGVLPVETLERPVISIGNLSVGGSGKTPFTLLLGRLLQERGIAFDILSRGYKRRTTGVRLVTPGGRADDFGDEPLLLAEKLQVPVIVGEERAEAGRFAERMFAELKPAHGDLWFHLLDDGFQHRRLARAFDIVLVNPEDLDDQLLPAGRLREPLGALERAQAIVLPEAMDDAKLAAFGKPIWRLKRSLEVNPEEIPARPIAFCGIAKPTRFFQDLRQAGVHAEATKEFSDHHAYSGEDVAELVRLRQRHRGGGFITTEKDAINLRPHLAALQPFHALPLRMEMVDAEAAIDGMLATIGSRR